MSKVRSYILVTQDDNYFLNHHTRVKCARYIPSYFLPQHTVLWILMLNEKCNQTNVFISLKCSKANIFRNFYKKFEGKLCLILAKAFDNMKATGIGDTAKQLIDQFNALFKLGTVAGGVNRLQIFDLETILAAICGHISEYWWQTWFSKRMLRNTYLPKAKWWAAKRFWKILFLSTNSSLGCVGRAV